MTAVTLYRGLREDRRRSMEIYADSVAGALAGLGDPELSVATHDPALGPLVRALPGALRMRAARYVGYPAQVRQRPGGVNHILDHGYAHLMMRLAAAATVVTVHDVIPLLRARGLIPLAEATGGAELARFTARYYRRAAAVHAISESTRADLIEHCGCDEDRVHVIYSGLSGRFGPVPEEDVRATRARLGIDGDRFALLIVGNAFYKNNVTSFRVFERLCERYGDDIVLIKVGAATTDWREATRSSVWGRQITILDQVDDDGMPSIYNAADCLLFPSIYEGFGWPPIEAMACGTPVVGSNVASLVESIGDGGVMHAPDDVEGMTATVSKLIEVRGFADDLVTHGFEHVKRFDWTEHGQRLRDLYRSIEP